MDLGKLEIPDDARSTGGVPAWFVLLVAVLCFAGGMVVRSFVRFPWEQRIHTVKTMVVRKTTTAKKASFTAGGWVEVAAPKYPITVSGQVMELLEQMHVKEGDLVEPGQLIAELYDKNLKAKLERAKARKSELEAVLKKMTAGYRTEDIDVAKSTVKEMEERLRIAKVRFARTKKIGRDLATGSRYDDDESAVFEAQVQLERSRVLLKKLEAGFRKEDVAEARARVDSAAKECEEIDLQLTYCKVYLPKRYPPLRVLKVHRHEGDVIAIDKGFGALVSLYNPKELQVRVDVRQKHVKGIKAGDPIQIITEIDRKRVYSGEVIRVDPRAELAKNTITVKGRIEDPDDLLFPEMVAQISFMAPDDLGLEVGEDNEGTILVPETAVQSDGDQPYVLVNDNGIAVRHEISIKQRLEGKVEVSSGLEGGQRIIIGDLTGIRPGDQVEE